MQRFSGCRVVSRDDYNARLGSQRSAFLQRAGSFAAREPLPMAYPGATGSRSCRPPPGPSVPSHFDGADPGRGACVGVPVQPLAAVPDSGVYGVGGVGGASSHGFGPPPEAKAVPRQVKDNFVNKVVDHCGPAVVRVETEQKVEASFDNADIFSFFFGFKPERKQERRVRGHGSGFCIDGNTGLILTNAHVVQGADRITALFSGRREPLECEVLETDEVIDVACIRVRERLKSPLPAMPLGYSESVRTGDWAIVLGNPLGLQNTCTLGIVSSLDRSTGETGFDWMRHPLLQTDAAVNQGNSGGPMLNELGEVVGMISMRALFGEGIGFAVPVSSIRAALPDLSRKKKVPRGYLGLKLSSSSPLSDDSSRGGGCKGAFVQVVLPRSPAKEAGFEVGDHIVEVNGRRITHFDEVQVLVRSTPIGGKLSFKVRGNGGEAKSRTLSVEAADIRKLREGAQAKGTPQGAGHRMFILP
eukprot:TRINITY_DN29915_c0_g1_i1.p1 TRINITY_DN29915_c0_g1~~TRINITY_DN29915_c0_g1_i1.p1  ORF type:complete len:472 (-),score=76.90 TRINITY_DN29915_c0_g1_i1:89-1504(-)